MSDFEALDRNLAALLTRAYVAVRPRESFREQLEHDFLARAARLQTSERTSFRRTAFRVAAAAVVLLAAVAWGWHLAHSGEPSDSPPKRDVVRREPDAPAPQALVGADPSGAEHSGSVATRDERQGVDVERPEEVVAVTESGPPVLTGSVVRASDGAPLDDFRITFLPIVQLPQVATPVGQEFHEAHGRFAIDEALLAATHIDGAVYRVEVQSAGLAAFRIERFEATPGATQSISAALEDGWTARGLVLDDATGLPIAGAWVVSESDTPLQVLGLDPEENEVPAVIIGTRTRADGGFELAHLRAGTQYLRASASGYGPCWSDPISAGVGGTSDALEMRLTVGSRIEGSVLDELGHAVVGVVLIGSSSNLTRPCISFDFAQSDAQGEFELHDLSAGNWVVLKMVPTARGALSPELKFATLGVGTTARVDFHAVLARQILRGTVRDTNGRPMPQIALMVAPAARSGPPPEGMWFSTTTGSDGAYELRDLEPGPYNACVSVATPADIVCIGSFELAPGSAAEHDFVLARSAIRGKVVSAATGAPFDQGMLLLLRRTPTGEEFAGRVLADAHGRYEFPHLPPGVYAVFAYALRGELGQESVEPLTLAEGQVIEGIDFQLEPGATLELDVVDAAGAPVAHAEVVFTDARGRAISFSENSTTDARGHYDARGMKPGLWKVAVGAVGYESVERAIDLNAGERPELRLELRRAR